MRRVLRRLAPHILLIPIVAVVLIPFVWLVLASLKEPVDFFSSMFIPRDADGGLAPGRLTLENFRFLIFGPSEEDMAGGELIRRVGTGMMGALVNSAFLSSVTALGATLCCAAGGYALAMYRFRGRAWVTVVVLTALIIPPPLLLAPGYQWLYRLGLLDSFAGLIIPALVPAFGVFLFRQAAIQSVPRELLEAARIDGSSELGTFARIGLPMLRPMVGAFLMITYLGMWNNFVLPQIVLQDPKKFPLAVAIAQMRDVYYQDYGLLMAGTVLSVAPVMLLFLLLQREFIAGLTSGAVKG